MKKELDLYIKDVEEKIKTAKDKKSLINVHKDKILFFQHERLIHLIVTFFVALLTIICLIGFLLTENIFVLVLFCLFLILLIPYIFHYYFLENGVQKLYKIYDNLIK